MTGRFNSDLAIAASLGLVALAQACDNRQIDDIPPYVGVAVVEAFAHHHDVRTVRAEFDNSANSSPADMMSYSRRWDESSIDDNESVSVVNYLTQNNDVVRETFFGRIQGAYLDLGVPGGRLIGDGAGFYHVPTSDGHIAVSFEDIPGGTSMRGEYCSSRSKCMPVYAEHVGKGIFDFSISTDNSLLRGTGQYHK